MFENINNLMMHVNNTTVDFDMNETFLDRFENIVSKYENETAVSFKETSISYSNLNKKANQLANYLIDKYNLEVEDKISIIFDPSIEMIIAILAVLKAGATYVPIAPEYPSERRKYMFSDSGSKAILTHTQLLENLSEITENVVDLDTFEYRDFRRQESDKKVTGNNLAYIIYTSGTTGSPKGVMIEHNSLLNLCLWAKDKFDLFPGVACTKYAGFGFDASVIEIFPALLSSATLYIVPKELRLDIQGLSQFFRQNRIHFAFLPTQFAEHFMKTQHEYLKHLMVGGDKLKKINVNYSTIIHNGYGPTEATVQATDFIVDREYDNIPIGKPISNYRVYILDESLSVCPIGVSGELHIAGCSLARGYLNRPELSAEKFINHPTLNERLYKTGDLAQWKSDGNIEFLGRVDFQVKIRGFRIELGEIETKLLECDERIQDAVVLVFEDFNGNKYLCAYYESIESLPENYIRNLLRQKMPNYMIPEYYIHLPRFPLTANGKVDRKGFNEPKHNLLQRKYTAPKTYNQKLLVNAFEEIFGLENVSIEDSFFELGGSSISAIALTTLLSESGYVISVYDILSKPVIVDLAKALREKTPSNAIGKAPVLSHYQATSSQRGIYFSDKLKDQGVIYNLPILLTIRGDLNKKSLSRAIDFLIKKHVSLRTKFSYIDGDIVQTVEENVEIPKQVFKISDKEFSSYLCNFVKPFDLATPQLFRVALFEFSREHHILVLDFHHIIFDGGSISVLLEDLLSSYFGEELNSPLTSYIDYSHWFNHVYINSNNYREAKEYWHKHLIDVQPMQFPYEYPDTYDSKNHKSNQITFRVPDNLNEKLQLFCNKNKITPYVLTISVYSLLLSRYTRSEEIVFGTAVSGRSPETEKLIGMFVKTLPFRVSALRNMTISSFIQDVKAISLKLLEHQGYNYEQMVVDLGLGEFERQGNSLLNLFFNFLEFETTVKRDGLTIDLAEYKSNQAMFNLMFTVYKQVKSLTLELTYNGALMSHEFVSTFMESYCTLLENVISAIEGTVLNDIDMLCLKDKEKIFNQFNNTYYTYPRESNLLEQIAIAIKKHPDHLAVVCGEYSVTYNELWNRVCTISTNLPNLEATTSECKVIGIFLPRSIDTIAAMLACWQSGYAYLCIDEKYPAERIAYMLDNSNAITLISEAKFMEKHNLRRMFIDINHIEEQNQTSLNTNIMPNDIAQLIFTSGSTGVPKAVMLTHQNLMNFSFWYKNKRKLTQGDHIAEYASFGFDAAIMGVYPVLISGGVVHILSDEVRMDFDTLDQYISKYKIKGIFLTTQLGEQYAKLYDNQTLNFLEVGGEKLKAYEKRKYQFINGYGPTESTVYVTDYLVDRSYKNIPIGKPLANVQIYIIDQGLNLCPIGLPGELCIAGESLANGYFLNHSETEKKFIPNPFREFGDQRINKPILYKTGDLAKWTPDGNIEVIGRIDQQVKINGFRIELGEVEAYLLSHPEINAATVLACVNDNGDKYLCAYYTSKSSLTDHAIKSHLKNELPEYTIPEKYIHLEKMPTTANGKVDKHKLPKPHKEEVSDNDYIAPKTGSEIELAGIWEKLLGINKVGVTDDFFKLGGNSIKAIAFIAEIQKRGMNIKINHMYAYPTIAQLLQNISSTYFDLNTKLDLVKRQLLTKSSKNEINELNTVVDLCHKKTKVLLNRSKSVDIHSKLNINTVLVTGGTGHLGAHIIEYILSQNLRVIALVRAENDSAAELRVKSQLNHYFSGKNIPWNKLEVHASDLTKIDLGLNSSTYEQISSTINAIMHSAAKVSHYGDYDEFYMANVVSTKNLLALAKHSTNCSFHYISTRSVCEAVNIKNTKVAGFTESDIPKAEYAKENVYVYTKLLGEYEVIKARNNGIMSNIYRVGNLVFNSKTLKHQPNIETNGFYKTIKSFLNIGQIYESYAAEMSCVDMTAEAICKIFDKAFLLNQTFHVYHPNVIDLSALFTSDTKLLNIESVGLDKYIDNMKQYASSSTFGEYIHDQLLHFGWLDDQNGLKTQAIVKNDYTTKILNNLGFDWGDISINNMIDIFHHAYRKRCEFLSTNNLFKGIDSNLIYTMGMRFKLKAYIGSDRLHISKTRSDKIWLIYSGFASLNVISPDGWEGTIKLLSSDDISFNLCNSMEIPTPEYIIEPISKEIAVLEVDVISHDASCVFSNKNVLINLLAEAIKSHNSLASLLVMMR